MADINVGDVRRVSAAIVNAAGTPTDPTTLVLKVRKPDDTVTTYTYGVGIVIVKDGVGAYHADLTLDQAGRWKYDWIGTGTAAFAEGSAFYAYAQRTA